MQLAENGDRSPAARCAGLPCGAWHAHADNLVPAIESCCNAVRACNECFLQNVAWDPSRSYDVFGSEADKTVVLVHGALAGRQSLVLEAKALAEVGFR